MAVGDVVNDVGADNVILDFQPAAGIEAVITSFGSDGGTVPISLYDGTNRSLCEAAPMLNIKMFVNNSNYMRIPNAGAGKFNNFTGIQIK
jgi:hypothetical protein